MIKKTIKFTDFNGEEQTEDFYFNLNKVEAVQLTANAGGDIESYARYLAESNDLATMITFIQDMILSAVGVRDAEGRRFIKSPQIRADFENSIAYAELFEELLENPEACRKFGEGLVSNPGKKPVTQQLAAVPDKQAGSTIGEIAQTQQKTPQQVLEELIQSNPEIVAQTLKGSQTQE